MSVLSIVLQALLGLAFLMAALGKISGSKMHVEGFKKWHLPQWFRVVTGLVELVGAVALILGFWEPSWAAVGGLVLAITGIGGIAVHMRARDSFKETFPIILLFILSAIVFFANLSDLSDFPGF